MDKFPLAWRTWQEKVCSYGVDLNDEALMEIVHEYDAKGFDSFPVVFREIEKAADISEENFFKVYTDIINTFKKHIDKNIDVNWSSSRGSNALSGFEITDEQHVEQIRRYYQSGNEEFLEEITRICDETGRDFFEVYTELKAKKDASKNTNKNNNGAE